MTSSMPMSISALAVALLLLSGCATAPSDAACPPPVAYDQAMLDRAADELAALPADAALVIMMEDYAAERAALRACR